MLPGKDSTVTSRFLTWKVLLLLLVIGQVVRFPRFPSERCLVSGSNSDQEVEPRPLPLSTPSTLPQCPIYDSLQSSRRSLRMYDEDSGVAILGMPKGGATLATQLMFRYLNLTEEALEYSPWIHDYRIGVYDKTATKLDCRKRCGRHRTPTNRQVHHSAICIKIVRSPLDRIVSSYIHVMRVKPQNLLFSELDDILRNKPDTGETTTSHPFPRQRATFADFVAALRRRSKKGGSTNGDDHFLGQTTADQCDDVAELIPLEAIHEGLSVMEDNYGIALNATGFTSHHYVVQDPSSIEDSNSSEIARTPFRELEGLTNDGHSKFPTYEKFFNDAQLNREVCKLLCKDYFLYARACENPLFRGNTQIQATCAAERRRVASICQMSPIF